MCVCVCVSERESERESVCVKERARERGREIQRGRERDLVVEKVEVRAGLESPVLGDQLPVPLPELPAEARTPVCTRGIGGSGHGYNSLLKLAMERVKSTS